MRALPITGEYPPEWKQISDATWAAAGHRCIRCLHPYKKGGHGNGEWSPCDARCTHGGPIRLIYPNGHIVAIPENTTEDPAKLAKEGCPVYAQWRIGTVHHFDGNKSNCEWWNLLALCQRCHLTIQGKVDPQQPYMFEHSDWLKPYVAAFYAWKYEGRQVTRIDVTHRIGEMDRLLALERIA